ncbi:hypothetical protein [Arsukibacterium sp.]|uniref:hypothetical protein n=1 Tax=Arsukibacterium sp. TaxID=1977258 RepID=UPI002FD98E07
MSFNIMAETEENVLLQPAAHVCTDEMEVQRLANNQQLREMAKALAEFKPTRHCFIMDHSVQVKVLEKQHSYIKFSHQEAVYYTFLDNLSTATQPVTSVTP